jgi:NADH pyrophosphatase NudC (nudix superfamily)
MKPFRFCPACGNQLSDPNGDGASHCGRCNRSWYRNAAPTAGAAIVADGRALVTTRAREPEKGRVDIVGGFLHFDENPIDGLKREAKEEIGVDIDVSNADFVQAIPHAYGPEGDWVLALGFKARLVSGDPTPSDDVAAVQWVTLPELDDLDWAWPHDRDLVRKALIDER